MTQIDSLGDTELFKWLSGNPKRQLTVLATDKDIITLFVDNDKQETFSVHFNPDSPYELFTKLVRDITNYRRDNHEY